MVSQAAPRDPFQCDFQRLGELEAAAIRDIRRGLGLLLQARTNHLRRAASLRASACAFAEMAACEVSLQYKCPKNRVRA
jgi:hypothetical protein